MSEAQTAAPAATLNDRAQPLFDVSSLDLGSCHRLEIVTALNEFEQQREGLGHRWETWPPDVQSRIAKPLNEWMERDASRVIRCTSFALHQGVAVLILHYEHKPK